MSETNAVDLALSRVSKLERELAQARKNVEWLMSERDFACESSAQANVRARNLQLDLDAARSTTEEVCRERDRALQALWRVKAWCLRSGDAARAEVLGLLREEK